MENIKLLIVVLVAVLVLKMLYCNLCVNYLVGHHRAMTPKVHRQCVRLPCTLLLIAVPCVLHR